MVRYSAIHRKIRPTIAVGPTGTFLLGVRANQTSLNQREWMEGGRFQLGLEGALGITYAMTERNNLLLEARYNLSYGSHQNLFASGSANQQDNFRSRATTFSIITGISF
ncbi:MAG: hypothetical protein WBA23_08145 [Tunicatimonas sp.]|uniref:hypothetical protein n=1 Tax=Tunicatimonas sp. TaxID=1940096 RepID=UPI003C78C63F